MTASWAGKGRRPGRKCTSTPAILRRVDSDAAAAAEGGGDGAGAAGDSDGGAVALAAAEIADSDAGVELKEAPPAADPPPDAVSIVGVMRAIKPLRQEALYTKLR